MLYTWNFHISHQPRCCCSATKLCPTRYDRTDGSPPGFPVLHCLPEFAQTHVHSVSDTVLTISSSTHYTQLHSILKEMQQLFFEKKKKFSLNYYLYKFALLYDTYSNYQINISRRMWPVWKSDGTVSSGLATWYRASWGLSIRFSGKLRVKGHRCQAMFFLLSPKKS